jgi:class 3 adenylate cyclase
VLAGARLAPVTSETSRLPAGTLTFVFTDVEGSTRLLRQLRERYGEVLAAHQRLLRDAFTSHGGHEVDTQGDSFFVAFPRPREAVLAAVAAQQSLAEHPWPPGAELRVRIGIHTGPAEVEGDRYVGLAVHRAARICAAGRGGQVLVSQATTALLEDDEDELPGLEFRDLGERRLKDFQRPVRVYQIVAGMEGEDAPPPTSEAVEPDAVQPDRLPAIRASDAERERAVAELREHAAAGRLTLEEFSERSERAFRARTLAELDEVGRDLPRPAPGSRPGRRPKRFTGVIFGATERTGRWRLPRFGLAFVLFGDADLDLRQAELGGRVASFTALVLFGNIDLYVPEGVEVDLGGFAVFGHRREWGRDVPPLPGTPLLRVHIFSLFGTADVWHVPASWVGRTFREVIRSLRSGEHRELPPAG